MTAIFAKQLSPASATTTMIDISRARSLEDFAQVRLLLDEMGAWDAAETRALGYDGDELLRVCYGEAPAQLMENYTAPGAELYLAFKAGVSSGCAGFKRMDGGDVELKKFFVRPVHRGLGVGRALMAEVMTSMQRCGHVRAKLETASFMKDAITMYRKFGFTECPPFREAMASLGPITVFMERDIGPDFPSGDRRAGTPSQ